MLFCRLRTKLKHFAKHGHKKSPGGALCRCVEHAAHGKRVGIIGIVNQQPLAHARLVKTLLGQGALRQTLRNFGIAQTKLMRHRCHGNHVFCAVLTPEGGCHNAARGAKPQVVQAAPVVWPLCCGRVSCSGRC